MKWDPLGWPVRSDYRGIGFKQLENKMSRKDEAFDKEVELLGKLGRFDLKDMVGTSKNPPSHYAGGQSPVDFIRSHGMDYPTGCCIKYLVRFKYKGQPLQDLKKCRAYLQMLIEDFEGRE